MHDVAQSVLADEIFMIQNDKCRRQIPSTVRHLSIWKSNLETSRLMELGSYSKLRSLLISRNNSLELSQNFQPDYGSAVKCWFEQLRNIRILQIRYCKIKELPESIGNLRHLRYLDISYNCIRMLPESLCHLRNLQVLDMRVNILESFPRGFNKLTNLSKLYIEEFMISKIAEIGKLISLKTLPHFQVLTKQGHQIAELKDLTRLHGRLCITGLENVESKEDACQAKLNNKEYLDELILKWSPSRNTSSTYDKIVFDTEVLEGLEPHHNLKRLDIRYYGGRKSASWLQPQILPYLNELYIVNCPNLAELLCHFPYLTKLKLENVGLDSLPRLWSGSSTHEAIFKPGNDNIKSSSLSKLSIVRCPKITSIEELPHYLPAIKVMRVEDCKELVSLATERFKDFTSLEKLKIGGCSKLICQRRLELPASIRYMQIGSCGELDKSLPSCLENLTSLSDLVIYNCCHLECLPGHVFCHLTALRNLSISNCPELGTLGLEFLTSLECLEILRCPKLAELEPVIFDAAVQGKSMSLLHLTIDNTSLLKLPFLRDLLSSLLALTIYRTLEPKIFVGEDEEWLQILASLEKLNLTDCANIKALPTWLQSRTSLKSLGIHNCPEVNSLPEKGLPTSLTKLYFRKCHPMLKEQLEKLKAQNSRIDIRELSRE